MTLKNMIEEFQCVGCVGGSDTDCGRFVQAAASCKSHVAGTELLGVGAILLGMPKGFNKTGHHYDANGKFVSNYRVDIWFYPPGAAKEAIGVYNYLNVPVWAMEKDGNLFVRVFMPRVNASFTQVVAGGTINMIEDAGFNPFNVSEFEGDID